MTDIQELALTESRSLRQQYADRTDVLDKIKALSMLPDGVHVTTDMVASYYEVPVETIDSAVRRNREELETNGRRVVKGDELREFETFDLNVSNRRSLALFNRRAVLNVGQLLTESPIAKAVRTYLLDVEELAGPEIRNAAIEAAAIARARLAMLKVAEGMAGVDLAWLGVKNRATIARGLCEEPEINPLDVPLYVPDYLKSKGLTAQQVGSEQSWFGKRVVTVCEEDGFEPPAKRPNILPNGQIRETRAWAKRHLPYFEAAWDRWLADKYTPQGDLFAIDGGA